jgi:hypothetical protein
MKTPHQSINEGLKKVYENLGWSEDKLLAHIKQVVDETSGYDEDGMDKEDYDEDEDPYNYVGWGDFAEAVYSARTLDQVFSAAKHLYRNIQGDERFWESIEKLSDIFAIMSEFDDKYYFED